MKVYPISSK